MQESPQTTRIVSTAHKRLRTIPALLALFIFSAGGATAVIVDKAILHPHTVSASESDDIPSSIREAWIAIHRWYVDCQAIDDRKLADGTIAGMLKAVGDEGHTRYLNAGELARYRAGLSGDYVGVGIQLAERDKRIVVVTPIDLSPAQRAGIHSGDILIRINGQETKNRLLDQVLEQIRGPEGSSINMDFERPGKSNFFSAKLKRERLQLNSVSWTMLPGKLAHIRLSQFSYGAANEVSQAIEKAEASGAEGIVFDLRNNPGGLISEAIGVSSDFLPEGAPVFVSQLQDGSQITHRAYLNESRTKLPVAVLVNQGTASSSEIIAGALKDNGRAKIIGEKTFGTGTLLNQFGLSNGGAALIGTEFWLTPGKKPIRGQGIVPDISVGLAIGQAYMPGSTTATESDIRQDSQLLRAISALNDHPAPETYASK
jgi:carboxyl-terminal processing protease